MSNGLIEQYNAGMLFEGKTPEIPKGGWEMDRKACQKTGWVVWQCRDGRCGFIWVAEMANQGDGDNEEGMELVSGSFSPERESRLSDVTGFVSRL